MPARRSAPRWRLTCTTRSSRRSRWCRSAPTSRRRSRSSPAGRSGSCAVARRRAARPTRRAPRGRAQDAAAVEVEEQHGVAGGGRGGRRRAARRAAGGSGRGDAGGAHQRGQVRLRRRAGPALRRDRGRGRSRCSSTTAGPGFDPEAVPEDRRGIRESIIGRMERHGGRAEIRTGTGEGTEVELHHGRGERPMSETPDRGDRRRPPHLPQRRAGRARRSRRGAGRGRVRRGGGPGDRRARARRGPARRPHAGRRRGRGDRAGRRRRARSSGSSRSRSPTIPRT